jgi:hypothetical protein
MTKLTYQDLTTSKITQLISSKESFEVIGLGGKLLEAVRIVENKIEFTGMTCRVYTPGRVGLVAGSFAGGITGAFGLLSATGIALHNLMTLNPDYEIAKYPVDNRIHVRYKKKKK